MRALCLTAIGGPDHLAVLDIPRPASPGPGQVRVAVRAVALNHLDLWVANGLPGAPIAAFPFVVGTDAAGEVMETGVGVLEVAVGDRVVINAGTSCGACEACAERREVFCRQYAVMGEHRPGLAAEEVVVPAINVRRIAGQWSDAEAASFTLATLTAWRMLTTRAALRANETILIWGIGGGVALQGLQVARHIGARIAVTSRSADKLERAAALGADLLIHHTDGVDVARRVKDHWGHGADVVFDAIGAPTWAMTQRALRPGGRMVTCGATAGPHLELDVRRLFWFQWSLLGSTMGTSEEFTEVVALGNRGLFRPVIDGVYPLGDGAAAYRRLAAGEQFGKLVLEVSP
jgi:NADPH:quinone reductase-like Zn-dependent oxidoreductase